MSKLDVIDIDLNNDKTQFVDFLFVFFKNIKTVGIIILLSFSINLIVYNLLENSQKSEAKFEESIILEQSMTTTSYKLLTDVMFSANDIFNIFFNKIQEYKILQDALISLGINDQITHDRLYQSLNVHKEVEKNKFKELDFIKKGTMSIEVIGNVAFDKPDEKLNNDKTLLSEHILKKIIQLSLKDINNSIGARFDLIIKSKNEQIKYLKSDHKESINKKVLLLNTDLYKIDVQTQINFKYALNELEENIGIAESMNYIEPQNDKIFGLSFVNNNDEDLLTMISKNLTNENDLFSTKLRIPLYFFGTKILKKEMNIIQERVDNSENNLSRKNAAIFAEIKKLKSMYGDEYILELNQLKRQIVTLKNAKKEFSDKYAFTLIQYNTDQITTNISKVSFMFSVLISTLVGLFASLIYIYLKEIMISRMKQLQNN